MVISRVICENMSHLLSGSEYENYSTDELHYSQISKLSIKVILLFWYPGEETSPLKLASIKIPKGTPVSKVRGLINFIETRLTEHFGPSKRANLVLRAEEGSDEYKVVFDLPLSGVSYV